MEDIYIRLESRVYVDNSPGRLISLLLCIPTCSLIKLRSACVGDASELSLALCPHAGLHLPYVNVFGYP